MLERRAAINQLYVLTSMGSWGAPRERLGWLQREVGGLPEASTAGPGRDKGRSRRAFLSGERLAAICQGGEISSDLEGLGQAVMAPFRPSGSLGDMLWP